MKSLLCVISIVMLSMTALAAGTPVTSPPKDNSAMNKRDANGQTLTPVDQMSGSKADVEVTRQIREVIAKDSSLSTNAHNIKIITINGMTTLRGTVNSVQERAKLASLAESVVSPTAVQNLLEVKTK